MAPTSLNTASLPAHILILAPQGMESQAIAKGLRTSPKGQNSRFSLQSIPVGQPALIPFLDDLGKTWTKNTTPQALLVMGVTGSLTPDYGIGDPVLVTECRAWSRQTQGTIFNSDIPLSRAIASILTEQAENTIPSLSFVKGISTNQVICNAVEKQALAQQSGADVVDMENVAILQFAQQWHLPVGILRVVSDTVDHDLPDLENIYDVNGKLKPGTLATRFISRPIAAVRLIQGSLIACQILETLATELGERCQGGDPPDIQSLP